MASWTVMDCACCWETGDPTEMLNGVASGVTKIPEPPRV
jgi:hypothetical protein